VKKKKGLEGFLKKRESFRRQRQRGKTHGGVFREGRLEDRQIIIMDGPTEREKRFVGKKALQGKRGRWDLAPKKVFTGFMCRSQRGKRLYKKKNWGGGGWGGNRSNEKGGAWEPARHFIYLIAKNAMRV